MHNEGQRIEQQCQDEISSPLPFPKALEFPLSHVICIAGSDTHDCWVSKALK